MLGLHDEAGVPKPKSARHASRPHRGGVLVLVAMLPALIWRVFDEEKFLAENLSNMRERCVIA
jgi:hypothetical protein